MDNRSFERRRTKALNQLAAGITDKSPKGFVDEPVWNLINFINSQPDLFSTSSCSGRITLFQGAGGDKGGRWLLSSHVYVTEEDVHRALSSISLPIDCISEHAQESDCKLNADETIGCPSMKKGSIPFRMPKSDVYFRFEPFILAVEAKSLDSASEFLTIAHECGFRESGISAVAKRFVVNVRGSLRIEAPVWSSGLLSATSEYLNLLVRLANEKMGINLERIERFLTALRSRMEPKRKNEAPPSDPISTSSSAETLLDLAIIVPRRLTSLFKLSLQANGWLGRRPQVLQLQSDDFLLDIPKSAAEKWSAISLIPSGATVLRRIVDGREGTRSADAILAAVRAHNPDLESAANGGEVDRSERELIAASDRVYITFCKLTELGSRSVESGMHSSSNARAGVVLPAREKPNGDAGKRDQSSSSVSSSLSRMLSARGLPASHPAHAAAIACSPVHWERLGIAVLLRSDAFSQPAWAAVLCTSVGTAPAPESVDAGSGNELVLDGDGEKIVFKKPEVALAYRAVANALHVDSVLLQAHVSSDLYRSSRAHVVWRRLESAFYNDHAACCHRDACFCNDGLEESGQQTASPSDCWVKHKESGVIFALDLTRSMFSSGNGTEKERVASLAQQGETVVDLYAGIGYFTLPLLVKARVAHIFACEANIYAVTGLRRGLRLNHVEKNCTILVGDNRRPCVMRAVRNCADRVHLGLLPSSEDGWRVGLVALSVDGGVLHVHANVAAGEEFEWADKVLLPRLQALLTGFAECDCVDASEADLSEQILGTNAERGSSESMLNSGAGAIVGSDAHSGKTRSVKNRKRVQATREYRIPAGRVYEPSKTAWKLVLQHVEIVKNYAARVHHVVFDVFAGPPERSARVRGAVESMKSQHRLSSARVRVSANQDLDSIERLASEKKERVESVECGSRIGGNQAADLLFSLAGAVHGSSRATALSSSAGVAASAAKLPPDNSAFASVDCDVEVNVFDSNPSHAWKPDLPRSHDQTRTQPLPPVLSAGTAASAAYPSIGSDVPISREGNRARALAALGASAILRPDAAELLTLFSNSAVAISSGPIADRDSRQQLLQPPSPACLPLAVRYVPRLAGVDAEIFARSVYPRMFPVVMTGLDVGTCTEKWKNDIHLATACGEVRVSAHVCPTERMSFLPRNFTFEVMTFEQLLKRAATPAASGGFLYLRSLGDNARKDVANLSSSFPRLASEVVFPPFVPQDAYFSSVLRVSSPGLHLWTHFDVADNFLIHVCGRKKVTMWEPEHASNLYIPMEPNASSSCMTDISRVSSDPKGSNFNERAFPRFSRASGLRFECELLPGDVLFIPALWLHHVETVGNDVAISVNVFWRNLPKHVYQSKDLYGNKDLVAGAQALELAQSAAAHLKTIPSTHYKRFYALRCAELLALNCS